MRRGDGEEPATLAVLAALPAEGAALRHALSRAGPSRGNANVFRGRAAGRDVLVAVSGVGREPALEMARFLTEAYRPHGLIVAGVAGALDPTLGRGQFAVSRRIRHGTGRGGETASAEGEEIRCDDGLVEAARRALRRTGLDFVLTDCATVDEPIATVREKTEAWNRLGAGVVDMEAYWAGLVAREKGTPFLSVRVVLDRACDSLPTFTRRWRGPEDDSRIVRSLLARPWRVPQALLLRRRLSRAAERLTAFLPAFLLALDATQPGSDEETREALVQPY